MNKPRLLIMTACDATYFTRAAALIQSVLMNTTNDILCRIIGEIPDLPKKLLKHPRITFRFDPGPDEEGQEFMADYAANIRAYMMAREIERTARPVLWLDADSLVRGPISVLEAMLENSETIAYQRLEPEFRNRDEHKFLISTVGVSASAHKFCRAWIKHLEALRKNNPRYRCSIMTVQLAYKLALDELGLNIFSSIPLTYTDMTHRDFSPIWEAQGPRKFHSEKYLAEEARYRTHFEKGFGV